LLVITESALIGLIFRWLRRRYPRQVEHPLALLGFGVLVHAVMLVLVELIPKEMVMPVLGQIWVSVITLYPFATMLICLIYMDQEARIAAERALHASEERFRSLVESSTDHIFMLDRTGRIVASNGRGALVGMPSMEELVGKTLEEIHMPEVAVAYRRHFEQVLETGEPVRFEHHTGRSDDRIHSDVLFPIRANGEVVAIGGICHDITTRIRSQEALRVALTKYRACSRVFRWPSWW
jgi:PAS domain S-box-containing protein